MRFLTDDPLDGSCDLVDATLLGITLSTLRESSRAQEPLIGTMAIADPTSALKRALLACVKATFSAITT
jgi:hypothetical protein